MPHGRDEAEWNELVERGYRILSKMAGNKDKPISYTDFSNALAASMVGGQHRRFIFPQDRNAIGTLLADISKRGIADRPGWLLSALVTGRNSNQPGGGFYVLAKSLGLLSEGAGKEEQEIFFWKQLEGLWKEYALDRRQRPAS